MFFVGALGCAQLVAPVANVTFVSVEQEREVCAQFVKDVDRSRSRRRSDRHRLRLKLGRRLEAASPSATSRSRFA